MIRRVRIKFTLVGMTASMIITIVLILAINLVNAWQVERHLDNALLEMSQADSLDGREINGNKQNQDKDILENDSDNAGKKRHGKTNRMSAQTQYAGRIFSVLIDENGSYFYKGQNDSELTDEQKQLVDTVLEMGAEKGTLDSYRFLVQKGEVTRVFFLDCVTEYQERLNLIKVSALVGTIGVLVCFAFIFLMSGKVVLPVKESMEKQKRFITDAGHELKTPLSVIGTNMDILSMDIGENEWVDGTKKQVHKLRRLVNNLITLSRMDEEATELALISFNISNAALESAQPFVQIAEMEGKELRTDISEGLSVTGDEATIRQLFTILCDNAVKYSSKDEPVLVRLYADGKKVHFETINAWNRENAPEKLDTFFDRFYRSDSSRDRRSGKDSYGLGLSIAQGIAQKNRAVLSVHEDSQKRLVFSCVF